MNKVKLKEICRLINGRAYKQQELLDSGKYPVLRVGNFFSDKEFYYSDMELDEDKYCENGDLLFAWSASFGPKIWNGGKVIYHYHIWKMELTENVDKNYLYYYLYHLSERIKSEGHGGIMIHTTKAEMEEREFVLPELLEQREIAKILAKVVSVIEMRKQELEKLDELIKARFVEIFGDENNSKNWDILPVEEVADVQVGVVIKPSQYYTDESNGIRAFRSLNIGEGFIKNSDWAHFTKEGHQKNSKSILKENDLLIVRSGAPGTACVVTKEYAGYNAIDIIIARPNCEKVNPYYLCTYTNMPHGKKQIEEGTGGAAQQHFNVGKYNKLKLMMPPRSLQDEFVNFIKQVNKSKVV